MGDQDPALEQEIVDEGKAPIPPEADETVESEEPQGSEETEQEPTDDKKISEAAVSEPEPELELVIEGDDPPAEKKPAESWVKELRREHRDLKARNAELERQLKAHVQPQQVVSPGPEPTFEGCDFDDTRFKNEVLAWQERKQEATRRDAEIRAAGQAREKAWNDTLQSYAKQREELSKHIPKFAEAETVVETYFSLDQQGWILEVADEKAKVVCALGQNPTLAQDLSKVTDRVTFLKRIVKLEGKLKMSKRTSAPPPDRPVKGSGPLSGSVKDPEQERLIAYAQKTGDVTKLSEYNRKKRANERG